MTTVFIVVAVVLTLALAVVLVRQPNPEQTSTHDDDPVGDTPADRFASDRPAGPDAEDMGSVGPGQPAPDPDIADRGDPPSS